MELQGVVLAGVVLIAVFYVLPYVYRRRRILSQTPLDDGQSQDLRILNLGDARAPKSEVVGESHDGVLLSGNEVAMSKSETKETAVDMRSLARERAKRRARVAKREANRTRGVVGVIVFGVLVAGLWVGSATLTIPVAVSIVFSVLFACYVGGFVYLVSQMNKANEADLDAIDEVDAQLKAMRRSASQLAQQRARSRVVRAAGRGARQGQARSSGREKLTRRSEVAPVASSKKSFDEGETIIDSTVDSTVSRPSVRAEQPVSYSAVSSVPSYTLKRSELVQRDIAPYEPPAMPEGDVPYRPTKLGERLDVSSVTGEVSGDGVVASEGLSGGAFLDDALARRRA
ncbi:MAG: hypothetical protein IKS49_01130 [Actinomycetaceae bacterium]|nr:hypothetical protein [Actinomycetaceae bacterium]